MANGLKVVKTLPVVPALIVDHSFPADAHPTWSPASTYAKDAKVVYLDRVWQSVSGEGNLNKAPNMEAAFWVDQGPVNLLRAFDLSSSTMTRYNGSAFIEIMPGQGISNAMLLNVKGTASVRAILDDPGFGVVYDETQPLSSSISESTWYAWTFEPRVERTEALFADIPTYPSATLRLEFTGVTDAGVGVIAIGQLREIGVAVNYGARLGIQDFSRKDRNEQGDVYLNQRAFAKEASFTVTVDNSDLDNVYALLASLRATPCMWIATEYWRSTSVWGFYRSFSIDIAYFDQSNLSIELEGLI